MAMIENGVGGGDLLKINALYEAHTFSITEAESLFAAGEGDAYNLNTGDITSLTAGDATLMYFKNDEDEDYITFIPQISELAQKIERLVMSCSKLEDLQGLKNGPLEVQFACFLHFRHKQAWTLA